MSSTSPPFVLGSNIPIPPFHWSLLYIIQRLYDYISRNFQNVKHLLQFFTELSQM